MGDSSAPLKILVAVDFGTTFSAVAFANTEEPEKSSIVTAWGPNQKLRDSKIPSVLKYDNGGMHGLYKYGFEAQRERKHGEKIHEWFKLCLCPELEERRALESSLERRFPSKTALSPTKSKDCEKLVTDYLTMLAKSTDDYLKNTYDPIIYELPREYIITVPAMWSDKAQKATRDCAAEALSGDRRKIQIIAEPEAAGVYALSTMPRIGLQKGDTFVICDAGGGTVDLSSYEIKSLEPYIELAGASTPSGGLCGSSYLNRIYADYVEKKLSGYIEKSEASALRWLRQILDFFEDQIKKGFTGSEPDDYEFEIEALGRPDSPKHDVTDGFFRIKAKTMREKIFDPVISQVQGLVKDHVAATRSPKALLLAGGFAQNEYLKAKLRETIPAIPIREVKDSRTAIVRGALIAGLPEVERQDRMSSDSEGEPDTELGRVNVRVISRRAPKHYGVSAYEVYDPNNKVHREGDGRRILCKDGEHRIEVMKWFIAKASTPAHCTNEDIKDGEAKTFGLFYDKEVSKVKAPAQIRCNVYASEKTIPPMYPHTKDHPNPDLKTPLLTLEIELDEDDLADLQKEKRNGHETYKVDFDVHMTLYSAKLTFFLVCGNKRFEPKEVNFY
ncbi:hypothetical protein GQ53DRAFT_839051 [Thozetella sp. PMI_491]|nr:hypothetical protein GQ53DRAFT_839051 [Thozetella sp. PMI_491]